ncbi:MAG TPA: HlyD family type I secretion periplasmic adaptor subunit [Dongiaceae bacterium]|jgi:adhesin transport system membrane fusion protein|nr:HlyD family type I secretion periplasmic adaptor subunit [Dongiaceae bacterium]
MSLTNQDIWVDPSETEEEKLKFSSHLLIGALCAILIGFLVWANFAPLDQYTRGEGRVIPSSSTQIIQSLDGGILSELRVREGEIVEKGQSLALIENTAAKSSLAEQQARLWAAEAASARLQAEIDGTNDASAIIFPADVIAAAPEVVEAEKALFTVRKAQLESQRLSLLQDIAQRENEVIEIHTKIEAVGKQLALAQSEHDIMAPLVKSGATSKMDMLKGEREMAQYQADISTAKASLPRAEAALAESKNKVIEAVASFKATAAQELAKQRLELATVRETLNDAGAKVRRTELRSPVRGTVKDIKIKTVGGVIQVGAPIMEIVPIEDTLLIEAQVRPADRGFIAPGQDATVKISAYDYSIYGGLEAKVEDISADTLENEKKETFFRVRVRTNKNSLLDKKTGGQLQIIPGMTGTVDILTGKKTVMQYLLKPLLKAKSDALTER